MNRSWRVGEVEIRSLFEMTAGGVIQSILTDATPETIRSISWLYPDFADEEGNLKAVVQAFLVSSGSLRILVDTCVGNDKPRTDIPEWSDLHTDFLARFDELGVSTEEIDIVVCTHLHMDHVGWNTTLRKGQWVPTFPTARYLFARGEWEYWRDEPEQEIADDHAAIKDSVRPIVEADLADFVELDHVLDERVRLVPSPGHTPGHVSVFVESLGESALITGDFLHHPCQVTHPEWNSDGDSEPEIARSTRQRIISELADGATILIGSHFAGPGGGHVVKRDQGFALTY